MPGTKQCKLQNDSNNEKQNMLLKMGGATLGGYLIYRGIRLLPSLLPPLWPSIPFNLATP